MSGGFEIYGSKAKLGLTALGVIAGWGYALHVVANKNPQPLYSKWGLIFDNSHQAAIACLVLLFPLVLFSCKLLFSSKPVITINGEGFYDDRHTKHVIPWNGILNAGLSSMKFGGANMELLALELTEYEKKNTRFTLLHRVNALFYRPENPNVIFFHLNGLDCDYAELLQAIHAQRHARPASQPKQFSNRLFG